MEEEMYIFIIGIVSLLIIVFLIYAIYIMKKLYIQSQREKQANEYPNLASGEEFEKMMAEKEREEQAKAYIERQNKKYEAYLRKKAAKDAKEAKGKKEHTVINQKDEHLAKIYRIGEPGEEMKWARVFTVIGVVLFFLSIPIALPFCESFPEPAFVLIITAIAWFLLCLNGLIGITFRSLYNNYRYRVYLRSERGYLYYCQLQIPYVTISFHLSKILQDIDRDDVAFANDAFRTMASNYYYSDEFTQQFEKLIRKESVNIKYNYTFMPLYDAVVEKRGKLADLLIYTDEKGKTHKLKVHKSFEL